VAAATVCLCRAGPPSPVRPATLRLAVAQLLQQALAGHAYRGCDKTDHKALAPPSPWSSMRSVRPGMPCLACATQCSPCHFLAQNAGPASLQPALPLALACSHGRGGGAGGGAGGLHRRRGPLHRHDRLVAGAGPGRRRREEEDGRRGRGRGGAPGQVSQHHEPVAAERAAGDIRCCAPAGLASAQREPMLTAVCRAQDVRVRFVAAGNSSTSCIVGAMDGRCFTWGRNDVRAAPPSTASTCRAAALVH